MSEVIVFPQNKDKWSRLSVMSPSCGHLHNEKPKDGFVPRKKQFPVPEKIIPAPPKDLKQRIIDTWNRFSVEGFRMGHRYTEDEWEAAVGSRPWIYEEIENKLVIFTSAEADEFIAVPMVAATGWRNTLKKWYNCSRHEGHIKDLVTPAILTKSGFKDILYTVKEKGEVNTV
jgi:hypothetical protein